MPPLPIRVLVIAVLAAACGSSPSAPTPPQNPPPPIAPSPNPFTLNGRVVGTVTGAAIAGATVTVGGQTFTTDADGAFTITDATEDVRKIVVRGNGFVTRESHLSVTGRTATIDVIQDRPPFDLIFFRTFARNALETDSGLEPLRPLRLAPRIHIRTVDERGRRSNGSCSIWLRPPCATRHRSGRPAISAEVVDAEVTAARDKLDGSPSCGRTRPLKPFADARHLARRPATSSCTTGIRTAGAAPPS